MSSNEFNFAGAGIRVVDFIPNSDGFKSLGLGGASFFAQRKNQNGAGTLEHAGPLEPSVGFQRWVDGKL